MRETAVWIFREFKKILTHKFCWYSAFFTLWTLFLLYNNNFFFPFYFWIVYSSLVLLAVPVLFIIAVEDKKTLVRILYALFTAAAVFLAFYLIHLKGAERDIAKNEVLNVLLIFSFLPIIAYMLSTKKFFLSEWGFSQGRAREAFLITLVFSAVAAGIAYFASYNPQFTKMYPMIRAMKSGGFEFFKYETGFLLFFFLWEFYFRGAMLFSFVKSVDSIPVAVLMQAVIFAFAHLGKPGLETISSLFGGIALGVIVLRMRTFVPAAVIHFILALTMDIISVFFKQR